MSESLAKRRKRSDHEQILEVQEREDGYSDAIFIPHDHDDDSDGSDSDSDSEVCLNSQNEIPKISYLQVLNNYEENQTKLEPNYNYVWVNEEKKYDSYPENENLLPEKTKEFIRGSSNVQLFELFFSTDLKNYIIECSRRNDCSMTLHDLDVFLGIIILSIVNQRKSQKDYWSNRLLLACPPVAAAMSRDKFLKTKSNIKFSVPEDQNPDDRAWRVRNILEIFKKNALQFGFFSTALSVDEMMVKFHGRTILLQFMKDKPVRFGIKMWALCNAEGYLFNCDIYCGKGSNIYTSNKDVKLAKCALGSRVVMQMVQKLLTSVVPKKITQYHLYFDNFFCNPDLLIHLRSVGLRATGTVRRNRVNIDNELDNKSVRGTVSVKHEEKSGLNYITVMDSKPVSLLSTAAGVIPLSTAKRYSKESKSKNDLPFPRAFTLYNKYMGGVDLHDGHCSNLMPCIRAKRWTWSIFLRLIQSSITNAVVIHNLSHSDEKIGSKEMALSIAEFYLAKSTKEKNVLHERITSENRRNCKNFAKCNTRTTIVCKNCDAYFCHSCFMSIHNKT